MANIRKTAMGNSIDIDRLRLANETTIAVGNTKTNARGDQLGAGGKVIKTRSQIMQEYHKVDSALVDHGSELVEDNTPAAAPVQQPQIISAKPAVDTAVVSTDPATTETTAEVTPAIPSKPRGSFADAIAQTTEVNQELIEPTGLMTGRPQGLQRL